MLIGITVMQHAFAGGNAQGIVSDVERRALALTDSREAGTTGRWVEPERRALEESCGAPA